jgi:hypothetical protein
MSDGIKVIFYRLNFYYISNIINRIFHEVLIALNLLFEAVVKQPDLAMEVPPRIIEDRRFSPYFNNYISAINSTHIHAFLGVKA